MFRLTRKNRGRQRYDERWRGIAAAATAAADNAIAEADWPDRGRRDRPEGPPPARPGARTPGKPAPRH